MRAFVALDLPEALLQPLTRLQAGLSVGRTVPEENLHLTLAFLDEVSDGTAYAVVEALAAARFAPVTLALAGLELFGGRRPAVLAVGASGAGLDGVRAKVNRQVREAGVALARRRFRPHVTIARFGREIGPMEQARLAEFLSLNGRFALPPEPALSVSLYRSHLSQEGAVYEALASFPLSS